MRLRPVRLWLALGYVLLLSLCPTGPAAGEWFGDLYLGAAFTGSRDIESDTAKFRNVGFDTSGLVGGRGGYWFEDHDYLALAIDVNHFRPNVGSQTVSTDQGGPARLAKLDVAVTALSIDLMLRYPLWRDEQFPKGRLQPYFLVGPLIGITRASDSTNFGPPNQQSHTSSSAGFNFGVGLLWQVHRYAGLFGEYRSVQFRPSFNFGQAGKVEFNVNSNLLLGGVSFRF